MAWNVELSCWMALAIVLLPAAAAQAPATRVVDDTPEGEPTYHFDPSDLTVAPGASFVVQGGTREPHTFTHDAPKEARLFDSGNLDPNATATITAPSASGDYPFHCLYHPGMKGVLHVASAAPSPSPSPSASPSKPTPLPAVGLVLALVAATFMRRNG